jgi:hypothetical protein
VTRLALLALVLASCTRVERMTVSAPPPSLAELAGAYAASWGGPAGLLGVAGLAADLSFVVSPYPCLVALPELGGSFVYDEASGRLEAEGKTLDGSTKALLHLRLVADGSAAGSYEVLVLGSTCAAGPLELSPTD